MEKTVINASEQVIFEEPPLIQKQFDDLLNGEFISISEEVEKALTSLKVYGSSQLVKDSESKVNEQTAYGVALLHKCINDMLASYQILRLGRVDWAHGIVRSAIEALCMAVLVIKDKNIFERYRENKFPVNKSLTRLTKQASNLKINPDYLRILKEFHESTRKSMHPTYITLQSNMFLQGEAVKWSIGGHFDKNKEASYKIIARSLSGLAVKIREFVESLR